MTNDDDEVQTEPSDDGDRDAVDLQEIGDRALQLVQRQATAHPLRTVGIAMGIGYVLGGGVPKLFVRLGMIAAGRALSRAATIEGVRMVATMVRGRDGDATADEPSMTPPVTEPRNGHRRKRGAQARAARHD